MSPLLGRRSSQPNRALLTRQKDPLSSMHASSIHAGQGICAKPHRKSLQIKALRAFTKLATVALAEDPTLFLYLSMDKQPDDWLVTNRPTVERSPPPLSLLHKASGDRHATNPQVAVAQAGFFSTLRNATIRFHILDPACDTDLLRVCLQVPPRNSARTDFHTPNSLSSLRGRALYAPLCWPPAPTMPRNAENPLFF